jgi:PHP family Zn ribbon phosphoesterase
MKNSIYSQLGFLPENLKADALEISKTTTPELFRASHPEISRFALLRDSDAHYPEDIGTVFTEFFIDEPSFSELRLAMKEVDGRKIIVE